MEFSIRAMKQLIKNQTTKRVAKTAAKELGEEVEEFAEDIAEEALNVAEANGRKTVRASDIREVIKSRQKRVTKVETVH